MYTHQIQIFQSRVPKKPYHTDDFARGLSIASAQRALRSRYIQPNSPTHRYWLVYDVDRPGAALGWSDRNAPAPNITATNPQNGHAHLIYGLEIPVRTAPDGRPGPLRYAASVDVALATLLDADLAYSGLICKNPCHTYWQVQVWEPATYDLDGIASWLDLRPYNGRKPLPAYGLGRNCTLFEKLRTWAYRAIRQGWPEYDRWYQAVEQRALGYNLEFATPLDVAEVRHTASSVARWTFQRFSPTAFSQWQAAQGAKKGKALRDQLLPVVAELLEAGFSQADIAREVEQSRQTISNWVRALKSGSVESCQKAISDNSPLEGPLEGWF